jgi:uncharacterized membrane protein
VTALRLGSLIAATITTGLIAGLFFAFACAVMPGLHRTEDRTFVDAMRVRGQLGALDLVRTVASIGSFGCLIWALLLHGRHS